MEKVLPLLESSFGGWKAPGPAGAAGRAARRAGARRRARSTSSTSPARRSRRSASAGSASPRSTPDYFPIQVMNTILGGSFSSRLNLNLREKNGYTYGASSGFDMRASAGPFVAAAGVQTDKTSEALTEFFNELNGILKTGPGRRAARARRTTCRCAIRPGSKPRSTSRAGSRTRSSIACRTTTSRSTSRTSRPSPPRTCSASRRSTSTPTRFAVVITGDRKVIEPGIRALKLGPIKMMTIDEVFGPAPAP